MDWELKSNSNVSSDSTNQRAAFSLCTQTFEKANIWGWLHWEFGMARKISYENNAGVHVIANFCQWTHALWHKLNGFRILHTTIHCVRNPRSFKSRLQCELSSGSWCNVILVDRMLWTSLCVWVLLEVSFIFLAILGELL